MALNALRAEHAVQGDTAVHRDHRGHRLGLLLKIEMMRWLAEAEPQIVEITTWNNADNRFMIDVNEAIGYRLSLVFAMYERTLLIGQPLTKETFSATSPSRTRKRSTPRTWPGWSPAQS